MNNLIINTFINNFKRIFEKYDNDDDNTLIINNNDNTTTLY